MIFTDNIINNFQKQNMNYKQKERPPAEIQLQKDIDQYIKDNSKLDLKRDYVGLSHIGKCERYIFNLYKYGVKLNAESYRNAYRGYLMEADMRSMLIDMGFLKQLTAKPPEIIVPSELTSGIPVKGHIDDIVYNGAGAELKSVNKKKFDQLVSESRVFITWFSQAQAYMLYGGYKYYFFIVRCTETTEHFVHTIIPIQKVQDSIQQKIISVTYAIATDVPPVCKCGHCNG